MVQALSMRSAPLCHMSAARCGGPGPTRLQAVVRASSSNGSAPGVDASRAAGPPVEMLEMVVADDLRPLNSGDYASRSGPTKRLVPAPHKATPTVASRPPSPPAPPAAAAAPSAAPTSAPTSAGAPPATVPPAPQQQQQQLNGSAPPASSSLVSSGSSSKAAAAAPLATGAAVPGPNGTAPPSVVKQLLSLQTSNKMVSAELLASQRQVQQQQLELKAARTELAAREAEVVSLKQELAEKDGKLKAARTDALESKMRLQQKDAELKEAYAQLSEAVRDRSAMRSQLAQTHAELAETRAELEQLADDILAIKLLMDEDGDSLTTGASADPAYSSSATSAAMLASGSSSGSSGEDDEALNVLESLAALSRQLAADAAEDDAIVQTLAAGWGEGAEEKAQ